MIDESLPEWQSVLAVVAHPDDEYRFRRLVDAMPDPTFVFGAMRDGNGAVVDLTYTHVNIAGARLYGRAPHEVLGRTMLELFPGAKGTGMFELFANTVATGTPGQMRVPRFDDQGVRASFDVSAVAVGDEVVVTARDITAALAAEQEIEDAERRYRLLAENATDAVFLVDNAGSFSWVSPAVTRVLGYQPQALIGVSIADLVHPEDLPIQGSVFAKVDSGQEPVHWEVRVRVVSEDYRWMSAVSSPAADPDGTIIGQMTALRDIHEQVLNRQALAHNEQTLRLAMQGAPQGVATVGLHGRLLQANPALLEMTGYDQQWMDEHTEFDLMHPDDVEADQQVRDRLLNGTAEYDIHEGRVVTAAGDVLRFQHSLALIRDEHNMPLFYVSQYQDITAARAARADTALRSPHEALAPVVSRDQLQLRIAEALAASPRRSGLPALLYCDLDRFKEVNDAQGRAAGDYVLRKISERIASVLHGAGEVAGLGGDEFVVLLPEVPDAAAAVEAAEGIRAAVAVPLPVGHGMTNMTMSVGVAVATDGVEPRRLLRNADSALYEAKNHGRNMTVRCG